MPSGAQQTTSPPQASGHAAGSATVLAARPVVAALDRLGVDAEPALRAAQLSRGALASIDHRLPWSSVRLLWEAGAARAADASFGVRVAEALPAGALDLFDYIMSTAQTVGDGYAGLTRYVHLIYDRSNLRLSVEPPEARLVRSVVTPAPQYDEFIVTLLLVRSRQATGTDWTPERVTFQHPRHEGDDELSRVLGCPVVFGADAIELRFAARILQLRHVRADSRLLAILERYADGLLASLPSRGDLVASVSSSIARQMARELPSLSSTAEAMHMPERALQRKLAESGVSHSGLVDEVRRGLALKHIGDARLGVAEIAYLLQFADPTAFHRAFKRWTGEAPLHYRKRLFPK
jgi:AraC-like DNA-binding protein